LSPRHIKFKRLFAVISRLFGGVGRCSRRRNGRFAGHLVSPPDYGLGHPDTDVKDGEFGILPRSPSWAHYESFPPARPKRYEIGLTIIYRPKHGSWRTPVEIDLNLMIKQRLNRRIREIDTVQREVGAWQIERH